MSKQLVVRMPKPELAAKYRAAGIWVDRTMAQELEAGLRRRPDLRFKVWSEVRPFDGSFAEVENRAKRLAAYFLKIGIVPGDMVCFQLPNWVEAAETFMATLFVGGVTLPVVHTYGAKEMKFLLAQSGTKLLVTTRRFRSINYEATIEAIRSDLPELAHVFYVDDYDRAMAEPPIGSIYIADPDEPAVINYTSGTTSDPKGVIKTHRVCVAEMIQREMREPGDERPLAMAFPEGYREWLNVAPIGHGGGLQTGVEVPVFWGQSTQLIDHWDVDKILDILALGKACIPGSATFFFNSLVNDPKFGSQHLDRMRYIASGGAPIPRAFGEQCESLGIKLFRGYGLSEHHSVAASAFSDPVEKRIGTDGRPLAFTEIQIRDDEGIPAPVGVPGMIHTRGAELFVGYIDSSLNDACFDADGWFCTGDVGVMDADGYLTITDRIKDIIIRGGENVSASEVENAIAKMPEVLEVAVVATPDTRMGEAVCAVIRLRAGVEAPDLETIRHHVAEIGLARQKWPERLWIVEEFERTPSGKIKKYALRDQLQREATATLV
jgi:acyl-CoA synthetase